MNDDWLNDFVQRFDAYAAEEQAFREAFQDPQSFPDAQEQLHVVRNLSDAGKKLRQELTSKWPSYKSTVAMAERAKGKDPKGVSLILNNAENQMRGVRNQISVSLSNLGLIISQLEVWDNK